MAASQGSYRIQPIAARKYGCLLNASAIIQNGPRSMPSDLGPMTSPHDVRFTPIVLQKYFHDQNEQY
jgi:hypothetical protein